MPLGVQFESVLLAAKSGAEWAIALLYRDLDPKLLRFLRAQEPVEGDDLASEVWLDAAAGLGRFVGDEQAFQRWIFTIARRRLIDLRRRRGRRPELVGLRESLVDRDGAHDPESVVLAGSETEAALARIGRLSRDQAEVVLLRVVGGFDVKEVATIIGKTPGAVRVLQHRALQRLAQELTQEKRRSVTR